jgi:hypothetical protein
MGATPQASDFKENLQKISVRLIHKKGPGNPGLFAI